MSDQQLGLYYEMKLLFAFQENYADEIGVRF